jgi:hypothetical protein
MTERLTDVEREAKRLIASAFAVPGPMFYTGTIAVPCEPGRICALIEYDEHGPVLDTHFAREEFALAMEQRIGGDLSDLALGAYVRRCLHLLGVDDEAEGER